MPVKRQKFDKKFIGRVGHELRAQSKEHQDALLLQAHAELVKDTPVDLGQARAGWNTSLNKVDDSVPADVVRLPGVTGPVYDPPPIPKRGAKKWTDVYHITNFVKHIVYLNEGASFQQEPKFIEKALSRAVKMVRKRAR